ncbi:MATE efflux family protein 8 [Morella rubra]|uniref:Protein DETOXIFICATION n=1 Tax=Morella rubra TaxID=262757 RepID=A0A6A1V0R2_9ROSI|nr:MATE efflux family protein 8 [Morella rubra]
MEKSLLLKEKDEKRDQGCSGITWSEFAQEAKRVGYLAGPMVAVNLSQYFLQIISIMMVGHLGELSLSSTAIAISLAAVSGFSPVFGMSSALETICGQAYGAQQYRKVGNQTYTAIFSLFLVCLPLSLLWIYMGEILVFIGQDPIISHEAGKFIIWLIPALFAYATLQVLVRYFQTQSLIVPMLVSSSVTLCFHIPLCWLLVFKSSLNHLGGALAIGMSYWLNVILLGLYMKYTGACAKTRVPISTEMFQGIGEFFRVAIPSAVMICLEWWSFELLTLLSGLLPNPKLETSVLSVCLATMSTLYMIPDGLGAAASTRVSNELGAGNPQAAGLAVTVVMFITITEALIVSSALFASRHVFGYIFSNEKEVVDYVTTMAPLVCLSVLLDNLHGVLSGVARGCGWQDLGAYVNLGAYYLCGLPVGAILGFWVQLRGKGLWVGILVGAFVQALLLAVITSCTDWRKQANKKTKKRGKKKPPDKTPNHSSSGNTPSARAVATAPVASQKEMGKAEKEQLMRTLSSHLNTIHETFQLFDQSTAASLDKVNWEEVIKMGEEVSKQATISGMLWTGETPEVRALEENMAAYFNVLQGFLLLFHGSTVGAGHTLSSSIHASVKQVVDCSFKLFTESVSSHGSRRKDQKLSIPQFVGAVWESCSALKKTPSTNITAVGRAMTQAAVSMKDVLREMKELKPGSANPTDETYDEASNKAESEPQADDDLCDDDLGNDLSPEEMKIAQLAIVLVSETLVVIKELIRTITVELGSLGGTSQAFLQACDGLRNSLRKFQYELDCPSTADLEEKLQDIALSN